MPKKSPVYIALHNSKAEHTRREQAIAKELMREERRISLGDDRPRATMWPIRNKIIKPKKDPVFLPDAFLKEKQKWWAMWERHGRKTDLIQAYVAQLAWASSWCQFYQEKNMTYTQAYEEWTLVKTDSEKELKRLKRKNAKLPVPTLLNRIKSE